MKAKKLFAMLLALVMVVAMGTTAFAATNVPKDTDTATVTIKNVEAGATVTLYQIVKGVYNSTCGIRSCASMAKRNKNYGKQ